MEKCNVGLTHHELLMPMLFEGKVCVIGSVPCIYDKILSPVTDKRIYLGHVLRIFRITQIFILHIILQFLSFHVQNWTSLGTKS